MQPVRPQPQTTAGRSAGSSSGKGLWPHSPAIALAPGSGRPATTMPPPTPVPSVAPNTTLAPAAAPSIASDRAKQLASLAIVTGRATACSSSLRSGRPATHGRLTTRISSPPAPIIPGIAIPSATAGPCARTRSSAIPTRAARVPS